MPCSQTRTQAKRIGTSMPSVPPSTPDSHNVTKRKDMLA
jgi:hypothetical protein